MDIDRERAHILISSIIGLAVKDLKSGTKAQSRDAEMFFTGEDFGVLCEMFNMDIDTDVFISKLALTKQ